MTLLHPPFQRSLHFVVLDHACYEVIHHCKSSLPDTTTPSAIHPAGVVATIKQVNSKLTPGMLHLSPDAVKLSISIQFQILLPVSGYLRLEQRTQNSHEPCKG